MMEAVNRHDWEALAANEAGATFVNHRQLASGQADSIVDHWSSIRTMASLVRFSVSSSSTELTVIRMENFDLDQRELALARFEELNRSGG